MLTCWVKAGWENFDNIARQLTPTELSFSPPRLWFEDTLESFFGHSNATCSLRDLDTAVVPPPSSQFLSLDFLIKAVSPLAII
jgi:hypothetical protein